jgi:hypothetical protein
LTSLRLGQLQEKKDSQASVTRRDIATLLQQRNIGLARAKAQGLVQDDAMGDLLEILEMHVGLILEHFSELDRKWVISMLWFIFEFNWAVNFESVSPSPNVVEAASSIIFAAPKVDSKGSSITFCDVQITISLQT